jgi:hypothetical protein
MRPQEATGANSRPRPRLAPAYAPVVSFALEERPAADAVGDAAGQQTIKVLTVTLAAPDAAAPAQFAAKK